MEAETRRVLERFQTALVVDDDELLLKSLRRMLAPLAVHVASNAHAAREIAARVKPNFALIDLYLPERSDVFVEELRHQSRSLVIGVMSGYLTVAATMDCIRRGATWCLEKPFDRQDLLKEIARGGAPRLDDLDPGRSLKRVKWDELQRVLKACGDNKSKAARVLGIPRSSLQQMLKRGPPT